MAFRYRSLLWLVVAITAAQTQKIGPRPGSLLTAARAYSPEPGSSESGFTALVRHLRRGISADQAVFRANAASGSDAFGGVAAGVIIATLLVAAGSAWGLSRRLAEYR